MELSYVKKPIAIEQFLDEDDFSELLSILWNYTNNNDFPGWKLTGYSDETSGDKKFWYLEVTDYDYFQNYLFEKVKSTVKRLFDEDVILDRCYFNGATFGQQGYYHKDYSEPEGRTLLIYCNSEWKDEWSGGTVFETEEGILTVYPRPARAVYFPGMIPHFSQSLSKDFNDLRVTLAYKMRLITDNK